MREISGRDLEEELKGFTIIEFYTMGCPPCRAIKGVLQSLEEKYPFIKVFQIDAEKEDNREIVEKFDVKAVPYLLFFSEKEKIGELRGYHSLKKIEEFLKNLNIIKGLI